MVVVLSQKGWVRAAKGHEIEPETLTFKSGDSFGMAVRLRSQQQAVFIDSTGRSYSLPAHSLPSARGQGEPLTGRLEPPAGAFFVSVLAGEPESRYILASDLGYGFICTLANLFAKTKSGKAVINLSAPARLLPPVKVQSATNSKVAVATSTGHLLLFALSDLPELAKGKGNRLIGIPATRMNQDGERVSAVAVLSETDTLIVEAGQRQFSLKPADQSHYQGDRGRRGALLPRGFRRVERLIALSPKANQNDDLLVDSAHIP